jgi:hypothetical protein
VAIGLYVTPDGKVMVAYGSRLIPIADAQYKANGYKPSLEKLKVKPGGPEGPRHKDIGVGPNRGQSDRV